MCSQYSAVRRYSVVQKTSDNVFSVKTMESEPSDPKLSGRKIIRIQGREIILMKMEVGSEIGEGRNISTRTIAYRLYSRFEVLLNDTLRPRASSSLWNLTNCTFVPVDQSGLSFTRIHILSTHKNKVKWKHDAEIWQVGSTRSLQASCFYTQSSCR
jgi:hypothetical protein